MMKFISFNIFAILYRPPAGIFYSVLPSDEIFFFRWWVGGGWVAGFFSSGWMDGWNEDWNVGNVRKKKLF